MSATVKTAISLPRPVFREIEAIRKRTHLSRSRILVEAFQAWLKGLREKEWERQYVDWYRKHPEQSEEYEGLLKAGLSSWGKEKW